MKTFSLPYGQSLQTLSLPNDVAATIILPQDTPPSSDPSSTVYNALEKPFDFSWDRIQPDDRVAITINDKTRPVPNHLLLPPILARLDRAGLRPDQISLWIASGSHLPMLPEEFTQILPSSIIKQYKIIPHNADDITNLVYLGSTTRGTPVWVNKAFHQANLKIVVGDIEPHHFAGFSGGYKSAAIGMAGRSTINTNHKLLSEPGSWIGIYDDNPLRQDIEEIGELIGVDLAINAVLNHNKEIVTVFCGHPKTVIHQAIPHVLGICGTTQPEKFPLVIASAGGHPKDINFYQAQKALTHASMFCAKGGSIILAAACPEGTGNRAYEEFMQNAHTLDDVFNLFAQQEFRVGPHKAYQVARLLKDFDITLVSSISSPLVTKLLMHPAESVQHAVDEYLSTISHSPRIAILPHATTTLARPSTTSQQTKQPIMG